MKMHKRKNVLHIMHGGCIIMQKGEWRVLDGGRRSSQLI